MRRDFDEQRLRELESVAPTWTTLVELDAETVRQMLAEIRRSWARIADLELMLAPRVGGDEDGIGLV